MAYRPATGEPSCQAFLTLPIRGFLFTVTDSPYGVVAIQLLDGVEAGIFGVTPIRSILFHAAKQRLPHRILFFFSNRRPEDAPFLADLEALQKENPNYTFIPTMTELAKSHHQWNGETGYINKEMLAKYLSAAKSPIYYIVGRPGMVNALHSIVNESGVDDDESGFDDDDIRTEDFSGY